MTSKKFFVLVVQHHGTMTKNTRLFCSRMIWPPPPLSECRRAYINILSRTEYTECLAFCPFVRMGSPHPLTRKGLLLPHLGPRGDTHLLVEEGVAGPNSDEGTLWNSMYTTV
jgi:hypothetical protein